MNFDSNEELYFSWWLDELKELGLVVDYHRGLPFLLSPAVKFTVDKKLKTKTVKVQKHIIDDHIYTPDFVVEFNNVFINKAGLYHTDGIAHIEIKGNYDFNNMTRLFKINQKWVYAKYGVLVNLLKVPTIFTKTFTPARYLLTDKSGKPRKLNWTPKTLKQYLEEL